MQRAAGARQPREIRERAGHKLSVRRASPKKLCVFVSLFISVGSKLSKQCEDFEDVIVHMILFIFFICLVLVVCRLLYKYQVAYCIT